MPDGLDLGVGPNGLPNNFESISRAWMAEHAQKMADLTHRPATPVSRVSAVNTRQQANLIEAMMIEVASHVPMPPQAERLLDAATFLISRAMAEKVLGQYVPEWQAPGRSGLYLVKTNIEAHAERVGVDPLALAKYVALHEATHHWQFTANPWLETFMQNSLGAMSAGGGKPSLEDFLKAREQMQQVQAAMSLVEGHANFMAAQLADPATQAVHDRMEELRAQRNADANVQSNVLGKILKVINDAIGAGAKQRQYTEGEKFCEAVHAAGGYALLDKAFTDPSTLPTAREIANPDLWVARMTAGGTNAKAA